MIRIKTTISEDTRVYTLFFMGKWITLIRVNGRTSSTDAVTLYDAGVNHLTAAVQAKESYEHRRRLTPELLHGTGHQGLEPRTVPDRDDGADREGAHRDEDRGREEDVPTDSSDEDYKDTFAFG